MQVTINIDEGTLEAAVAKELKPDLMKLAAKAMTPIIADAVHDAIRKQLDTSVVNELVQESLERKCAERLNQLILQAMTNNATHIIHRLLTVEYQSTLEAQVETAVRQELERRARVQ